MRYTGHRTIISNAIMITAILLIGVTGASYSLWVDGIAICGSVSMGDIDIGVSGLKIADEEKRGDIPVSALISDDGKQIEITIDNAVPGYSQEIAYEIENRGSIPVEYRLLPSGDSSIVQIIQDKTVIEVDEIGNGSIIIKIPDDTEENTEFRFSFELTFQQPTVEKLKLIY